MRKVLCIGGGPAGLAAAMLLKRDDPTLEVEVRERHAPGATHGWGITFGEDLLDDLHRLDPDGGRAVRAAAILWRDQVVRIGGRAPVHIGGKYGFSMGRAALLDILVRRAEDAGVKVVWDTPVEPEGVGEEADLVLAADGAGSRVRAAYGAGVDHRHGFDIAIETGRNRYIWLGTERYLPRFTFAFERVTWATGSGWIWFYAYPSTGGTSTCIVECSPEVFEGLGLGSDVDADLRRLEEIFAGPLGGAALLRPPGAVGSTGTAEPWLRFRHLRTRSWVSGNVVLAGDAAHTTHFGIGSGTVLAVQDAVRLAESLRLFPDDLAGGLAAYDALRRAEVGRVQAQALRNMHWFEDVGRHLDEQDPVRFAYTLLDRRGDHPEAWRFQLHRATQFEPLRKVRQGMTTLRRTARAAKRERVG
ncbi:FAD-dependent monooxygenase [Pseudonocardia sp. WMMC193]|uniref:FAD-dependent monooxygenase n=1 Tax=Pseudonocardia sp. WMMC193 TaxID=2911965 RepID=UPI001F0326BC|nr:FAD-dependent monooxygenase [Pseudonocardia sp. WMMC193]MCF7548462.1 FAD-dependent monooxygenase [Pseudonocardia sp. WMMC193]